MEKQARIRNNLLDVIDDFFKGEEGHRTDSKFLELCERIRGREVTLVFIGNDAFEKEDNNYWLPDCCWEEIPKDEERGLELQPTTQSAVPGSTERK